MYSFLTIYCLSFVLKLHFPSFTQIPFCWPLSHCSYSAVSRNLLSLVSLISVIKQPITILHIRKRGRFTHSPPGGRFGACRWNPKKIICEKIIKKNKNFLSCRENLRPTNWPVQDSTLHSHSADAIQHRRILMLASAIAPAADMVGYIARSTSGRLSSCGGGPKIVFFFFYV